MKRVIWVFLFRSRGMRIPSRRSSGIACSRGTSPGRYSQAFDVGKNTTYSFSGGTPGQQYYFSVAAYVSGYVQGLRSTEVSAVVQLDPTAKSSRRNPAADRLVAAVVVEARPVVVAVRPAVGRLGGTANPGHEHGECANDDRSDSLWPQRGPSARGVVSGSRSRFSGERSVDWRCRIHHRSQVRRGLSDIYNGSVGLSNLVNATIGPGTYFVRVRARTGSTSTVTSNEISFAAGSQGITACTVPPPTPAGVSARVLDGTASVSWQPVAGAASYLVAAGSASGLSDVFYGNVGNSVSVSAPVGAGFQAYVRVIAVNACGQSAASIDVFMQ